MTWPYDLPTSPATDPTADVEGDVDGDQVGDLAIYLARNAATDLAGGGDAGSLFSSLGAVAAVLTAVLAGVAVLLAVSDPPSRRVAALLSGLPLRRVSAVSSGLPLRWVSAVSSGLPLRPSLPTLPAGSSSSRPARAAVPPTRERRRWSLPWRRSTADHDARSREACEVLALELRAGRPPDAALRRAAEVCPELAAVVASARLPADPGPLPPGATPLGATLPGPAPPGETLPGATPSGGILPGPVPSGTSLPGTIRPGAGSALRSVAIGWIVAERTGSGLADLIDRVVETQRDDDAVRREISAQLAGPRATARLLAALPAAGLLLGSGFGADPVGFALGTPLGLGCLAAGVALAGVGLFWVERLARRAEAPR